jgi:hypothetical protein
VSASEPYPFGRILRPGAPPKAILRPPVITPPPPTPAPTPTVVPRTVAAPKVTVRSTKLKVKSGKVSTSLSCTGTVRCKGTVTLKTASKVKLGSKKRTVVLTRSATYSIAAGKRATVKLVLSKNGKSVLRKHKRLSVRLHVKPSSGKTVTKKLRLTR